MANTTGNDRLMTSPWSADYHLKLPFAIPAAQTTYYSSQLIGRDANGNLVQADDTSKYEFIGIIQEAIRVTVDTTDLVQTNGILGDKMGLVERPLTYTAVIAAAAAGDEKKKVFIKFNNEVSYSPGTNGNFAGVVIFVRDSTHVEVLPPWSCPDLGGVYNANIAIPDAPYVMTKYDLNKTIQIPTTVARQITLPPVAQTSNSDRVTVVNTGGAFVVTLKGNAAENINGANTLALTGAAYATATVESDGTQWLKV